MIKVCIAFIMIFSKIEHQFIKMPFDGNLILT